jgi:hypothetical protein
MFPRNNFADLERDMVLEDINENLISEKSENLIYKDELANVEFGRCPICYDAIKLITLKDGEINPSPNVTTTPCGHSFCYKCLNTHLETKNKCPMCRVKISNKSNLKQVSVYEGCYVINQKVDQHLSRNINTIISAAHNLQDTSILLGSIKSCMYDALQSFRRLQIDGDSDDEYVEDDNETEL